MTGKLLVVDDDREVRDFMGRSLAKAGFSVVSADCAKSAMELVDDEIEIALVDLYLGAGPDGIELAHFIRARGGADVIIITGQPGMETAIGALREGAYDYLIKPFAPDELIHAVERCAEKRRLSADLARERALLRRLSEEIGQRRELERHVRLAQKMEALGRLAATIAHDFNSYLSVIVGSTRLLLETGLAPAVRGDVEQINRTALDAAALTRQILAFAKGEADGGGSEPPPVELSALVEETSLLLSRAATAKVRIRKELAARLPPVRVEPVQLRQILVNLVVNARDAMPEGGTVSIATAERELKEGSPCLAPDGQPGVYVLLEVNDTGLGMSRETLERIFEPYFTTKGAGKGSGLGLPIVYGIVRKAGGRIAVDSAPGKGTSFRLYFPAAGMTEGVRVPEAADKPR